MPAEWNQDSKLVIKKKIKFSTLFVSVAFDEGKSLVKWRLFYYPKKIPHKSVGHCECCEIKPIDGEAKSLEDAIFDVEDKYAELAGEPRKTRPERTKKPPAKKKPKQPKKRAPVAPTVPSGWDPLYGE